MKELLLGYKVEVVEILVAHDFAEPFEDVTVNILKIVDDVPITDVEIDGLDLHEKEIWSEDDDALFDRRQSALER